MALTTMYAAQTNSPTTTLASAAGAADTTLIVTSAAVLPSTAPFELSLGIGEAAAETVLVTAVSGNSLTVTRGWDGTPQAWPVNTIVARTFSARDLNDLQANIAGLAGDLNGIVDDTLSVSGKAADAAVTGTALYRSKDRAANTPAGLTWWNSATAGYSDDNPFGPAEMPVNTYTYTNGKRLSGFNNDVFTLSPSASYFVICLASLYNSSIREYIVIGSKQYYGRTTDGGSTVNWHTGQLNIDNTLTVEGDAADAKAVGDRLDPIESSLRGNVTPRRWEQGSINNNGGGYLSSNTRCYCTDYRPAHRTNDIITPNAGYQFNLRWYYPDKTFRQGQTTWKTEAYDVAANANEASGWYRIVVCKSDDSLDITPEEAAGAVIVTGYVTAEEVIDTEAGLAELTETVENLPSGGEVNEIFSTNTGNCTIRAAKMHNYTDGTPPEIEWFLLQEPGTWKFYWADRDLTRKVYLFSFGGYMTGHYSMGIMPNGDIIACRDAESLSNSPGMDDHDDSLRRNPYVWLASEGWSIQHEVDFSTLSGTVYPPCGWIENTGFCIMPDGSAVFGEYTRAIVEHCYVWKISGDLTDPANWHRVMTFELSGSNVDGFKHCHAVMLDHFTGISYLATGDDDIGARIYCSDAESQGADWHQLAGYPLTAATAPNENYCRLVNIIFTKAGAWWASDSSNETSHHLFFTKRDANGVLDWTYANIPVEVDVYYGSFATYGLCYLPELSALLFLERSDGTARPEKLTVRMAVIDESTTIPSVVMHEIADIPTVKQGSNYASNVGFRGRFKEFYPHDSFVRIGFGIVPTLSGNALNRFAVFGNQYTDSSSAVRNKVVSNLTLQVARDGDDYRLQLGTIYI